MKRHHTDVLFTLLAITVASFPFDHWNPFLPNVPPAEQPITLPEFFTVLTTVVWLFYILLLGRTQYIANSFKSPVTACILVYLLVSLFSVVNSLYPILSIGAVVKRIALFGLFIMIINIVRDKRALATMVTVLAVSAIVEVIAGFYELFTGDMLIREMALGRTQLVGAYIGKIRIQGLETDPDLLSMLLLLLTGPVVFMMISAKRGLSKGLWCVVFLSIGVNIIATGSRWGWLTLVLLIGTCFFLLDFRQKKLVAIGMLFVFLVIFSVMSIVPNLMVVHKIKRIFTETSKDITVQERKAKMNMAIDMVRSNPLLGVGTGASGKETPKYMRRGSRIAARDIESSVSGFGTLLGDNGLLGFIVYALMLLIIVLEIVATQINTKDMIWKNLGGSILIGVLAFIVCLIAYPSLGFRYAWVMYGLGTAYAIISRHLKQADQNPFCC